MRIGIGFDVHPLVAGRPLVIGGVTVPSEFGLQGHSDADVLSHAVGDAVLGAAALGDLGAHFPSSNENYANVSSLLLLKEIARLLHEADYRVTNIDAVVVLEKPKLAGHVTDMRKNLAECLRVGIGAVSVKATTSDRLGFVGEGKGAAAHAVALIEQI